MTSATEAASPLLSRVPLALTWLRRETAPGRPATVAYAALCTALLIPPPVQPALLWLLVDEGYVTEAEGQVRLVTTAAKRQPAATRAWSTGLTTRHRADRSGRPPLVSLLLRLYRERQIGGNATSSFAMLCDVTHIPHDLRGGLLNQLLGAQYVTREGDQVRLTAAGQHVAVAPLMPPPADPAPTPSPVDTESRVRTPRGSSHRPQRASRSLLPRYGDRPGPPSSG
jgi:hypothetical protein